MKSGSLSLQSVVRTTGLSAHVLRAWEKRYAAVRPVRTASGHRRYSEEQVERLLLLKRATDAGHSIGTLVDRPDAEIRRLLKPRRLADTEASAAGRDADVRRECMAAISAMNLPALELAMQRGLVAFGHQGFLSRIVAPLAQEIGNRWRRGEITAAHEHFFTAAARTFLGNIAQQFALAADAPALIAATPAGQHHELGAFMAAVAANYLGWRAIYLGASLPAAEIAAAVIQVEARVLVLSIIHPPDDRHLATELRAIRRHLPKANLLVGGRAAANYGAVLKSINARLITDLADLGDELDAIRVRQNAFANVAG